MASIRCGHCKGTHSSVLEVRMCAPTSIGLADTVIRHANTAERLANEAIARRIEETGTAHIPSGEDFLNAGEHIKHEHCQGTHKTAAAREHCETLPERVAQAESRREFQQMMGRSSIGLINKPAEEGWYLHNGFVCKVQIAHHGSGRPYAKRLTLIDQNGFEVPQDGKTAVEGPLKGGWEYVKGLVFELKPEHKLTREQAEEFGKLYGVCAICGAILTNEVSITRGIGPVCFSKMGF